METLSPLLHGGGPTVEAPPNDWLVPLPKISVRNPMPNSAASAACAALRWVVTLRVVFGGAGAGVVVPPPQAESEKASAQSAAKRLLNCMPGFSRNPVKVPFPGEPKPRLGRFA